MLMNLTEVLTTEGKTEEKRIDMEMTSFSYQGSVFRIQEQTPLTLKLSNRGNGKASIEGQMSLRLILPCDRCLKDVTTSIELSFDRQVNAPDRIEELSEEELDEQNFMEGYQLDVDILINNEILLNWPMKVLCRDNCAGICKVCGKDLNTGQCECDTFVPDPRMAKIKDIFNAGKEV